jgi:hypothetical protein
MAGRHRLTLAEQLAGVSGALKSKKTPKHLLPALRRRQALLKKRLGRRARRPLRKKVGWVFF